MSRILVVDDDPNIRELVRLFLVGEGMDVIEASNGSEALAKLESTTADMVILDIMMPQMDGWDLCRTLRAAGETPILMLTARAEIGQKIKGFDLGADDYVVKPFDPLELVARTKALLKRYRIAHSQIAEAGGLKMNRKTHEVLADGQPMAIPLKEFDLLFALACCPGRTLARSSLIENIWGYDFHGNERTLDVHINRLRERFPESRFRFRIRTIRGLGYRLEALE